MQVTKTQIRLICTYKKVLAHVTEYIRSRATHDVSRPLIFVPFHSLVTMRVDSPRLKSYQFSSGRRYTVGLAWVTCPSLWLGGEMLWCQPHVLSRNEFLTKKKGFLTKRKVRVLLTAKQLMFFKISHF